MIWAASSSAARARRRSGQSMMSRGSRDSPSRLQSCFERGRLDGVDGEVHGPQTGRATACGRTAWRGPWPGPCGRRATSTTWRRSTGASHASAASASSCASSSAYWRCRRSSTSTPSGRRTTTTHAPSVNLVDGEDESHDERQHGGGAVDDGPPRQWGSRWVRWYFTIPAPAMVKPVNTPMAYERDQAVDPGPGDEQQRDRDRR